MNTATEPAPVNFTSTPSLYQTFRGAIAYQLFQQAQARKLDIEAFSFDEATALAKMLFQHGRPQLKPLCVFSIAFPKHAAAAIAEAAEMIVKRSLDAYLASITAQ